MDGTQMFKDLFLWVLAITFLIMVIAFLIGRIEKNRLERKQEYMAQLELKQKHYYQQEKEYVNGLKKEKEEYEKLLNELDRNTLPTKEELNKLHWYMNKYGIINQHHQNMLNQFYERNYPNNPFNK